MEFVSAIFGKVLDVMVEPVQRQLGYLCNYESNVQELKECAQRLIAERQSLNARVQEAERNGENIQDRVRDWLMNMDKKITEIDNLLNPRDLQETGCSNGSFPNLRLRHKLGRKAKKMSPQCGELLQQANFPAVSYWPEPEATDAALYDSGYENFRSRDAIVEKVMNALRDPTTKMIGIYGQGGVGKTTLVKEVARKAKAEQLFNVVVMANITSTPDVRKIQGEIADMLGLRLDDESVIGRAGRLRQRLKKEKENALIILDDLWARLDLSMLGLLLTDDDIGQKVDKDMPNVGLDLLKEEKPPGDSKSCKILLTSRSEGVLREMGVKDTNFNVQVMEEKESEKLFNKVAGITDEDSTLKLLSVKIVQKCANLPIAIVAAGKALKNNKNEFAWNNALQQMERQEMNGLLEPVEFSTKLSYDHLKSEELKSIFLLCARIGKDPSIMDLVKYCFGLGIFQGVHTIKEAQDRTNTLINKLKDSSLLLNTLSSDRVTMHDMVCDAALSIASKEEHVFTVRNGILDEWPDKDKLERYTAFYLHHCSIIDDIPEGINCPRLKVFRLDNKDPSLKIPDKFFEAMGELRVLILTGIDLSSFPSSIKCLKKLRMLCLEQCVLGDNISNIGELKNLRILSLSGSKFELLPSELRQLGKLRLLDISNCTKLRVIPPNVISKLNSLEDLYMGNNLIQWDVERESNHNESASLAELIHLQQLRSLDIHIPNIAALPQSLFFDKLNSHKIVIGDSKMLLFEDFKMPDKSEASRVLALQLEKGNNIHYQFGIKLSLKKVEQLFLGAVDGLHNVIYELNVEGLLSLKHLTITKNFDIQYIIYSTEWEHQATAFPELESMYLYRMERIEKICNCQLTNSSFGKLKTIKIQICGRLRNLFSFYMVRLLTKLETIEVSECDSLEDIVLLERQENTGHDAEDDSVVEFPQLRSLTLQSLLALTCFYTNDKMVPISQTDAVPTCLPLFNANVLLPKLESLELSSISIKRVWVDQPLPSPCFQNLTKLIVEDCGSLKYLFSLSMVGSLMKLQSLFVRGCDMMTDIFDPQDISTNEASQEVHVFSELKKIEIANMEELKTIWHDQANLQSFCSLESVIIEDCHKLVTVFPPYMVGKFQNLGSLEVIQCKLVKVIFELQPTPQISGENKTSLRDINLKLLPKLTHVWGRNPKEIKFESLQHVSVYGCPCLETLFPFSVATDLMELEKIFISDCAGIKEVVAKDDDASNRSNLFKFPKLTSLSLLLLPKLTRFDQGGHAIEFKALTKLSLIRCDMLEAFGIETPFFSALVKVLSNLEFLSMGPKEMKWLQDSIGNNVYQMHHIEVLVLHGLSSVEILIWLLHRFPNLKSLRLISCVIKEALPNGNLVPLQKIGTVVQLKGLSLITSNLPLTFLFNNHPILDRVEWIHILSCHHLTNLLPSSVSFTHLLYLEVINCSGLKNLMTSSTAKLLVQLTNVKVVQCAMIDEIVTVLENEEDREDDIVFGKLKILELVSLRNLTSFCNSNNKLVFSFPSLEKVMVSDCLKLEKFSDKIRSAPNLEKVDIVDGEGEQKGYWEGDLNATIQKIFVDKVFLEYSQNLELSLHLELRQLWQGEVSPTDNCFNNLKSLIVDDCFFPSAVFPSKLLSHFKSLEELQVRSSPVEFIFDIDDNKCIENNEKPFHLKRMTLVDLLDLKRIWSKDPRRIMSFLNLQEIVVTDCAGIKTLFPASVAGNLLKLKKLEIGQCPALEEIVGKEEEEEEEASRKFEFQYLNSLSIYNLPSLKCFYPQRYTLECPNLERLQVFDCNKLDSLTSDFQSHGGAVGYEAEAGITSSRQPLFLVEKVIPNLENWTLNQKDMMMLSQGHFHDGLLHKLRYVELYFGDSNEAGGTLPFGFFQKVPNLESLSVRQFNALDEVFPSQGPEDINVLEQVKALYLHSLPWLSSIGLDNSWVDPLSKNLEVLEVSECPRLTVVAGSSAVSFCNLKQLTILKCHGLVSLFPSSVAKSLVQLELMMIAACKSIEQIVSQETDDESTSDEIIFENLRTLTLGFLPKLVSFYPGKVTLQFSALTVARIEQCPKMKFFSQGVVRAPLFEGIRVSKDEYDLHNHIDLNNTLHKLFDNKSFVCSVGYLELGDYPELQEIWHGVMPVPDGGFSQLKTLIMDGCQFLLLGIPFHLLPFLSNLEKLEVRSCNFVKAIFDVGPTSTPFSFSLKELTIKQLPNLEHVWNDPQEILSFQCLQQVKVEGCRSLRRLFPASMAHAKLERLEQLQVADCEGLVEIVGMDETAPEGATTKSIIFPGLTVLFLWNLPQLKRICPGQNNLEWSKLKSLGVCHCHQLKISLTDGQDPFPIDVEAIVLFEKVIPNLEFLSLSKENIMKIQQGQFQANFPQRLKFLVLTCFHDDADGLPYGFFQMEPLTNIKYLGVGYSNFNEIFTSQVPDVNDHTKMLFSQLKGLYLNFLPKLKSIGLEQSWVAPLPGNLETLDVENCPSLINLAQSTVSFSNLKDLSVSKCDGLVHLFTSSTAKCMPQLDKMSIKECNSIQEIVTTEGDESHGEVITFGNLKNLSLKSLPRLDGFYTGTYNLEFLSLKKVSILKCPQMKDFCQAGGMCAPVLVTIDSDVDLCPMILKAFKKGSQS